MITSPAEGWQLAGAHVIEGTGEPGRTVRLAGAVEGTGLVADDGRWSISVADQPVYGKLSVTAVLSAAGHLDSPSASRSFTVLPPAPEVTSMPDGMLVSDDARPASISGTGLDGAEVVVSVDGVPVGTVMARLDSGVDAAGAGGAGSIGGIRAQGLAVLSAPQAQPASGAPGSGAPGAAWSVPFPAGLTAGPHTLSVTQSIDGVASPPAVSSFILDVPAAGAATRRRARFPTKRRRLTLRRTRPRATLRWTRPRPLPFLPMLFLPLPGSRWRWNYRPRLLP